MDHPAADAWAAALQDWVLPADILDAAPRDPWAHPVARFAARADDAVAHPAGTSFDEARRALDRARARGRAPVVLDVGAGSGAAGLPLAATGHADRLVAVDRSVPMLAALRQRADRLGIDAVTVEGAWPDPDAVAAAGAADVVVCHHVLYDVADAAPFVAALTGAAREAVVVEVPPEHPLSWMTPLWQRFHGLDRPTRPTAADLVDVLVELGVRDLRVLPWELVDRDPGDPADRADLVTRRLCLPASRTPEVAAALAEIDVAAASRRRLVTLVWRGTAPDVRSRV